MALENKAQKAKREALEALVRIVQATTDETLAPEHRYTFCDEVVGDWLQKNGYAQMNKEFKNEAGAFAVRATEKGINFQKNKDKEKQKMSEETTKVEFVIEEGIEMPASKRGAGGGGIGNKIYPFEKLEVKQSFFVAGKEAKTFAGTVASANKRFSEEVKNEDGSVKLRTNRKGKSVPETKQVREFKVRADTKDGVAGVRVFRVM